MNLQPQRPGPEPGLNLTPLIDVVFLILVFLVVTTTLIPQGRLDIQLPQAGTGAEPPGTEWVVAVDANGALFLDGQSLSGPDALDTALRTRLAASVSDPAGARVLVRADARARHGTVAQVLDIARRQGVAEVGIMTRTGD